MVVSKLKLTAYRNHQNFELQTDDAKFIIISGNNGVGKTNVLEALSLYSPGRGLRGAKMDEIIPKSANDNSWFTNVELAGDENRISLGFAPKAMGEKPRRIVKANETILSRQGDIIDYLKVIWLTPQMDGLFSSSPSVRRKVVDRMTYNIFPEHAKALAKYEFAAKSRIRLLVEGGYNQAWMRSIESGLIDSALVIYKNRQMALAQISKALAGLETEFLKPDLALVGDFESFVAENEDPKAQLAQKYQQMRGIDGKAKKTIFGPNRTDLQAVNVAKGVGAEICSTGEQKSMVVALTLGQVKNLNDSYGVRPLVLLDEIFAHFDDSRVEQMIAELKNLDAQFWITTTDAMLYEKFCEKYIAVSI